MSSTYLKVIYLSPPFQINDIRAKNHLKKKKKARAKDDNWPYQRQQTIKKEERTIKNDMRLQKQERQSSKETIWP